MPSRGIYHKLTGGEARDDREMNITSRRTSDIELPNPRKPKAPNVLEGLRKAGEGLKTLKKLGKVE